MWDIWLTLTNFYLEVRFELPNMNLAQKNVQNVQSRGFCPKESNSICFLTLTIKKPSTLYDLPLMKNSIPSTRRGGARGWGVGISPFLFCTCLHMSRLCWFLLSRRNKVHTFIQSVSQYFCIHDHSFIHSFIHSLLHSCTILSWIMKGVFFKFTSFFLAWVLTCFTCSSSSSS